MPADDEDIPPAAPEGPRPTARPDALLPGTRLEEFEIERVIGTSGFGLVYLANDEAFERRVAIKEYLPDTLAMRGSDGIQVVLRASAHAEAFERGRRAFIEEAQLLARCHHPSLAQVQRHWESNGTVYRAMPFYPGQTLLELRQAMDVPPDEASLRALLDGLLGALEKLHEAGALHREIAPQHILLQPDDRPILLDAGAARRAIVGDQARALMMLLAPSFAPAEQTAPHPDRPVGPWTDLYSLAAVVKYCISGELPPPASLFTPPPHEPMTLLVKRLGESFPNLHYSGSFLAAIDAALAVQPRERPRDVAQWRALLEDHPPSSLESSEPGPGAIDWGEPSEEDRTLGPFYDPNTGPAPLDAVPPPAEHPAPARPAPAEPPRTLAEPPPTVSAWAPAAAASDVPADPVDIPVEPLVRPNLAARPEPAPAPSPWREPMPDRPMPTPMGPPAMFADEAAAPVIGYADQSRRRRRRFALASALLVAVAAGAGAWMLDRHQQSEQAQSGFAQAARQDGLTANVPAVPKAPEDRMPTAPAAAPTAAAPPPVATEPLPQAPTAAVAATTPPAALPSGANGSGTAATPAAGSVVAAAEPVEETIVDKPIPTAASRADDAGPARRPATAAKTGNGSARTAAAAAPRAAPPAATRPAPPERAVARAATNPREACGNRTQFSLYRCMQTQCAQDRFTQHPVCKRLRARDEVE